MGDKKFLINNWVTLADICVVNELMQFNFLNKGPYEETYGLKALLTQR